MSTWRLTHDGICPLDDAAVTMDKCQPCRFLRGASSSHHEPPDGMRFAYPHGWQVNCNHPRDGAYLAPERISAVPIPAIFAEWRDE